MANSDVIFFSINSPVSSLTLPSNHDSKISSSVKSDELQLQLDELDQYIAQLTQNLEFVSEGVSLRVFCCVSRVASVTI